MTIPRPRNGLKRLHSLFSSQHDSAATRRNSSPVDESNGLAWIILGASEHAADEAELKRVVDESLAPALLESKGITLLWHLSNTNPSARSGTLQTHFAPLNGGCCALAVRIHDVNSTDAMDAFAQLPIQFEPPQKLLPREPTHRKGSVPAGHYGANLKGYSLIHCYEPPKQKGRPTIGRCIVAVGIEPADGDEEMLDEWYRSEHLDLLAQTPMFVRCTRYRLLGPGSGNKPNEEAPRFLALHEYESHQALLDYAIEKGQLVPETAMSRKIFESAKMVERAIWEVVEDYRGDEKRASIVAVDG